MCWGVSLGTFRARPTPHSWEHTPQSWRWLRAVVLGVHPPTSLCNSPQGPYSCEPQFPYLYNGCDVPPRATVRVK